MTFLPKTLLMMVSLMLHLLVQLPGMSEEEHKSHHPEGQEGQGAGKNGKPGGMMGGGMMKMMDGMMDKMGAPKPKDLYPSMMSISALTDQQKTELLQRARSHMQLGVKGMTVAVNQLYDGNVRRDLRSMQVAVDSMQEHLALFESGLATKQIIEEGQAPRQVALQWFKREMNLLPPAGGSHVHGETGWSWLHMSTMVVLGGFFFCMLGMYYFKMRRATELIVQLSQDTSTNKNEKVPESLQVKSVNVESDGPWEGSLKVGSIIQETHDVKTFRLIHSDRLPFDYDPGQFLQIKIESNGGNISRAYTIASSPANRMHIEITVKRESEGKVSKFLHDEVKVGDAVRIKAPMGKFTFTDLNASGVVLIAGGVGITPMMSVLRYLYDVTWDKPIYLFYCCKTLGDYIFKEELEQLSKRFSQLHLIVAMTRAGDDEWAGHKGRVGIEMLTEHVPDLSMYPIHICGPVPMMDDLQKALLKHGVSPDLVKVESFGGKNNTLKNTASSKSDQIKPGTVVTFSGTGKSARTNDSQTILDVAESCGVDIENSCRNGSCGMCKVKLLNGEVSMECEDALDDEDRQQGVVLACQAVPKGNVSVEV